MNFKEYLREMLNLGSCSEQKQDEIIKKFMKVILDKTMQDVMDNMSEQEKDKLQKCASDKNEDVLNFNLECYKNVEVFFNNLNNNINESINEFRKQNTK